MHSSFDINHLEAMHTLEAERIERREREAEERAAFKEEYESDEMED